VDARAFFICGVGEDPAMIGFRKGAALASACAVLSASAFACSGKDLGKDKMQAAVDSMTKQRDSTMSRMDSAGVVHSDTARIDTVKRDTTRTKKTP
jgi:hypothetical protein